MTLLTKPLLSLYETVLNTLFKVRYILYALLALGLGSVLGFLMTASQAQAELTLSLIVVIGTLILIANKPLYGVSAMLIFMPFIEQWVEIPMGAGIPDLSFSRFVIGFLIVFMLAQASIGKFQFRSPGSYVDLCIVLMTLGMLVAVPISHNPTRAIQLIITRFFAPLLLYFLARNLVKNRADFHVLLWSIVIFGFLAALYAIYEQLTGNILFVGKETDTSTLRTTLTGNLRLLRGLLGLAANFGRVFLTAIPIAFYLLFETRKPSLKLVLLFAIGILFIGMFLTYNRTSWLAMMIGLFVLQFFYKQFRVMYIIMALVAGVVLAVTWDSVSQSEIVEQRISGDEAKTEGFNGRDILWQTAYRMWQAQPIRGWGFERFEQVSGRFRPDGGRSNLNAIENDFLRIMVDTGLLGVVPYIIYLALPLYYSVLLFFQTRNPSWSGFIKVETIAVYWAVMLAFLLGSYTQVQVQPIVKMLPFALTGAVIGTHERYVRQSKKKITPDLLRT